MWKALESREAFCEALAVKVKLAVRGASSIAVSSRPGIDFDADDSAQLALIYALESFDAGAFEGFTETDFDSWLYYRARSRTGMLIRKARAGKRDCRKLEAAQEYNLAGRSCDQLDALVKSEEYLGLLSQFPNDQQMMELLALGFTWAETAAKLGISFYSLKYRIKKIKDNAAQLV